MNLIIQPYRYALSIAVVAAGFLLMETTPLFWPPIYQNARAAILVMFLGFALLTLSTTVRSTHVPARSSSRRDRPAYRVRRRILHKDL
ncbi:hypothetical protein D3C87_1239750 [compost metagenome]